LTLPRAWFIFKWKDFSAPTVGGTSGSPRSHTPDKHVRFPRHSESETLMPEVLFSHDPASKMSEQHTPGHNRWHPEIPAAATARSGQEFRIECREWTDGQIGNNDTADDVRNVDLDRCHMLSGPIEVEGAEPGDLLMVDIMDIGPIPQQTGSVCGQGWGYSGIFAKVNGGGFLTDYYPDAYKAI